MINLNALYFLFTLLLISGGAAAMAKNDYGIALISLSLIGMGFISLMGGISTVLNKRAKKLLALEYFGLIVIFSVLAMRTSLIHLPYVELFFTAAGLLLISTYALSLNKHLKALKDQGLFRTFILILFMGVILYLVALTITPYSFAIAQIAGGIGFICLLAAFLMTFRIGYLEINGQETSIIKYLNKASSKVLLLASLFLIYSAYTGAIAMDFIPDIHSSKLPQGYYELVDQAEAGNDTMVDGKYKYQIFEEKLEDFLANQGMSN